MKIQANGPSRGALPLLRGKAGKEAYGKKRGERRSKETSTSVCAKYPTKCHRVPDAHNRALNNKGEEILRQAEMGRLDLGRDGDYVILQCFYFLAM